MMKIVLFIVAIFALFAMIAVPSVSAVPCNCGDICVNETGWWCDGGVINPSGTPIQDAIDNATAGETICVKDGTYNENVDVTKSHLTIRSENGPSVTTVSASLNPDNHVFDISDQTDVTLEGFEIRDAHGTTKSVAGIYMNNASECKISDNIVMDISASGWFNDAYGIWLEDSSDNSFGSSTDVSYINTDATWGRMAYGIYIGNSNNNSFSSSTSVSYVNSSILEASGIFLDYSNNNSFSSSTDVSYVNAFFGDASGITLWCSNNNSFSSNTNVFSITASADAYGIILRGSTNNRFNSSTSISYIDATLEAFGILLEDSTNNRFSSSTSISYVNATDWDAYGIYLWFSSDNSFSSGSISDIKAPTWWDFYSEEDAHGNSARDITISSFPTTISFTYDNGIKLKSVETPPTDPAGKMNIGKYVNATKVTANSWIFLNVSYSDGDLGSVDETTLKMYRYNGTDWELADGSGINGVNQAANYVYAKITSFSVFAPLGNVPVANPDLVITEKYETFVDGGHINITYKVNNIGGADAGASNTTIYINGVPLEVLTPAIPRGECHENTVGPFDCPCGVTLNVTVCADNDNVVDESNETNNCEVNIIECPGKPGINVEKTVWDPVNEEWVEKIDAEICDIVKFNSTIHNNGTCCDLTNIVVMDTLSDSLEYVGVQGGTPEPDEVISNPDGTTILKWTFTRPLAPCESMTFLIDAHVTKCGDDWNKQNATAYACGEIVYDEDYAYVNVPPKPGINVEKTVWDPVNEEWVEKIDAEICDIVKFNSTIHNNGTCCDLTNIVVMDTLSDSLEYVGVQGDIPEPDGVIHNPDGTTTLKWFFPGPLAPCETITLLIDAHVTKYGDDWNKQNATADACGTWVSDEDYAYVSVPPLKSDLVITEKWVCWPDNCTICYNVTNIGEGTAPACHNTTLYVEGVEVAHDHVPVDLAPGESYTGCFNGFAWAYTPPSDNITVCADNKETLVELDETNNCLTNIWMCGDVNGDEKVTMSDVRKVFNRYLDPNYPLDLPWAADVNGDGKVTMSDVRKVFNRYLDPGYELNCCCGGGG